MIFGKITYLNLLPFHIFLKRALRHSVEKKAWLMRGSTPSKINRDFEAGRIDAAVISSIKSEGHLCTDFGIIANGEVMSVLLFPGKKRDDTDSDTSNALARILGLEGEVMIGDKALKYRLEHPNEGIDLAQEWKEKTGLPFVFATLCAHPKYIKRIRRLSKRFFASPPKIPYSTLKKEAEARDITPQQLQSYLSKIYYRIGWRERRALKLFKKNYSKIK